MVRILDKIYPIDHERMQADKDRAAAEKQARKEATMQAEEARRAQLTLESSDYYIQEALDVADASGYMYGSVGAKYQAVTALATLAQLALAKEQAATQEERR